jgi:ergothioneine biosynthesis protein EgtB
MHYFYQVQELVVSNIESSQINYQMIELGIQHEKQHQELIIMDLKYILSKSLGLIGKSPSFLQYSPKEMSKNSWISFDGGINEFGAREDEGFYFDNENPRHQEIIRPFEIQSELVTNGDYLEFIEAGGYTRPELWLSDGLDWVRKNNIQSPLYWFSDGENLRENFFGQSREINLNEPVSHINFYEADAYARFCQKRLPSEFELELYFQNLKMSDLWSWSNSFYQGYPGFKPFEGFAKEYNEKFMSGQITLRGGCLATRDNHYRHTYRNFYRPENRWQFSGIRLVKDIQ